MAATYTLDVVTPERVMLSEPVTQTIAPGSEGQLGILANHAPLMTELAPGEVTATLADGRTTAHIVISGGFMEVAPGGGQTTILADVAERADEIDITRAEADLAAARQMLAETEGGSDQQAEARRSLAHAETRIRVSRSGQSDWLSRADGNLCGERETHTLALENSSGLNSSGLRMAYSFVTALLILGAILGYQAGLLIVASVNNPITTNSFASASRDILSNSSQRATAFCAFTLLGILVARLLSTPAFAKLVQAGDRLKEMKPNEKVAAFAGVLVGLLLTLMLSYCFPIRGVWGICLTIVIGIVLIYLGVVSTWSMKDDIRFFLPSAAALPLDTKEAIPEQCKILDTNVIIDGRVADICRSGFIEGPIYVPGFVLDELQHIADSADGLKRARGRRGLDILNAMRTELKMMIRTYDSNDPNDRDEVDAKLVKLAKKLGGKIVTNDYNLNKVAELQGVAVLNINELANAVKPVVLPGEEMLVTIIKDGKEPDQGVAYLDDGTMIVVEGGRRRIGDTLTVITNSVLQTVAGKMIFARIREEDEEEEGYDRSLRAYPRSGPRRKIQH